MPAQTPSQKEQSVVTGRCLCGGVRFVVELPTLWSAHCHCTLCQRAHGAPLVTWVGVDCGSFSLTGDNPVRWYESSEDSRRGFCADCGSTLFFSSDRWPGEIHIVRTAFEQAIDREPSGHVFFESHAPWFPFEDALERRD